MSFFIFRTLACLYVILEWDCFSQKQIRRSRNFPSWASLDKYAVLKASDKLVPVGITAAVATLVGSTSGLFYGFSFRVLYSDLLFGTIVLILSIYMGLVARQVDHQAI